MVAEAEGEEEGKTRTVAGPGEVPENTRTSRRAVVVGVDNA